MQNSMVLLTFFILDRKNPIWPNLIQKKKKEENSQFKLKFGT